MIYKILATGSTGNAVLLNGTILIDIGVPYKVVEPYIRDISLVLLTHIHGDHFRPSTVGMLARMRPAIRWGCCEWMVQPLIDAGVMRQQIDVYTPGEVGIYTGFCVIFPEELRHNVPNCCWHVNFPKSNERVFYATDTGTLDEIKAPDYDLYLIEANHTQLEITQRLMEKLEAGGAIEGLNEKKQIISVEKGFDAREITEEDIATYGLGE